MKTIVWDIDDVLNDLTRSWFDSVWKRENPEMEMQYEQLTLNPPHELLGMSREAYQCSLDRFRLSSEATEMKPDSSVLNWFNKWGAEYRHIALTARPIKTVSPAVSWLMDNFGEWFEGFGFVPSRRLDEHPKQPDKKKRDFLAWLGKANYFIDDHVENIEGSDELGIRSFIAAQPWNGGNMTVIEILETINRENAKNLPVNEK